MSEYRQFIELCDQEKLFAYLPDIWTHFWNPALASTSNVLAIEIAGQLIGAAGYGMVETAPEWLLGIVVQQAYRRQGIGSFVYDSLLQTLRSRGARRVLTSLYSNQLDGRRFAASHGFCEVGSSLHYRLDVAAATLDGWGDPDATVAAQGLRFVTLDRFPRRGLAERLLPLWNATRPDQPQHWAFVPYHAGRFEREMLEPDAVALAHSLGIVTADNRVVALALNAVAADNCLYSSYIGVDPAFRRRGLASMLKRKLVTHARAHGIAVLAAENDARNAAMRGINEQLGYRLLLELGMYEQKLAEASS